MKLLLIAAAAALFSYSAASGSATLRRAVKPTYKRKPYIFHIERGLNDTAGFEAACRLVEGLSELYGSDRVQLRTAAKQPWLKVAWSNLRLRLSVLIPTLAAAEHSNDTAAQCERTLCTVTRGEAPAVRIGDANSLKAFLHRHVAAGPRPMDSTSFDARQKLADAAGQTFDYDLIVVGGGSGGLACVKEAAKLVSFTRHSTYSSTVVL
jgi:hypothetical protein